MQAQDRLQDSRRALRRKNNAYALRLAQECVELCVKASLRSVGIEYPKLHEVSALLVESKQRFPDWFASQLAFVQEASVSLFKKRELAFYGGEDVALPPDRVIGPEDGKKAVKDAEGVFDLCSRLFRRKA